MPPWRLRDFHEDDLDQAISVWDQSRSLDEAHPVLRSVRGDFGGQVRPARGGRRHRRSILSAWQPRSRRGSGLGSRGSAEQPLAEPGHRKCPARRVGDPAADDGGAADQCASACRRHRDRRPAELGLHRTHRIELFREARSSSCTQMRDCWPISAVRSWPRGLWQAIGRDGTEKQCHREAHRAAAGRTRLAQAVRRLAAEGGHPVRPAWDREDKFRQGGRRSARLAVRRTVPVTACDA